MSSVAEIREAMEKLSLGERAEWMSELLGDAEADICE